MIKWIWLLRVASLVYGDDVNPVWAEEQARQIKEAGFNAVILTGFHYRMYFPPEKREDIIRKIRILADACHKYGLKIFEHHSATLVPAHSVYVEGEDVKTDGIPPPSQAPYLRWAPINARTGKPDVVKEYDGIFLCPNNPGHQEAYLQHVRDILLKADVDGLMSDDVEYLYDYYSCVCPFCREKFKRETALEIPPADDKGFWGNYANPAFRKWLRFRQRLVGDHYERLKKLRDEVKSSLPLLACQADPTGLLIALQWSLPVEEIARGADILFYEVCGAPFWRVYFPAWWEIASNILFLRGLGERLNMPVLVLFYPKEREEWFFTWALAKSCGANVWFFASQDIKQWIKWEEEHPQLFYNTKQVANIAILFSRNTRDLYSPSDSAYVAEWRGWCTALLKNSIPFRVLTDEDITPQELRKYHLLILPNVACLSDEQVSAIREFVRGGGKLIATAETSLCTEEGDRRRDFALRDLFGISYKETLSLSDLPVEVEGEGKKLLGEGELRAGDIFVSFRPISRVKTLGRLKGEGLDFAILHEFGKGKVLYIATKPGFLCLPRFRQEGEVMEYEGAPCLAYEDVIKRLALWGTDGKPTLMIKNGKGVLALPQALPGGGMAIHLLNIAGSFYEKGQRFPANEVVFPPLGNFLGEDKLRLEIPGVRAKECTLFVPPREEGTKLKFSTSSEGTKIEVPLSDFQRYAILILEPSGK